MDVNLPGRQQKWLPQRFFCFCYYAQEISAFVAQHVELTPFLVQSTQYSFAKAMLQKMIRQPLKIGLQVVSTPIAVRSKCLNVRFLIFSFPSLKLYSLDQVLFVVVIFFSKQSIECFNQTANRSAIEDKLFLVYAVLFVEYLIRLRYPLTLRQS